MPTPPATAALTPAPQALIGRGKVWHQRVRPAQHRLEHDSYFLMLHMRLGREHGWTVPRQRFGWITFADQDHGEGGPDALAWFDALLQSEGIVDADGEVWAGGQVVSVIRGTIDWP